MTQCYKNAHCERVKHQDPWTAWQKLFQANICSSECPSFQPKMNHMSVRLHLTLASKRGSCQFCETSSWNLSSVLGGQRLLSCCDASKRRGLKVSSDEENENVIFICILLLLKWRTLIFKKICFQMLQVIFFFFLICHNLLCYFYIPFWCLKTHCFYFYCWIHLPICNKESISFIDD